MALPTTKGPKKAPSRKFSSGRGALSISDRSGLEFPYNEMVKEWTGALVHKSEWEPKQPQLDPTIYTDPEALQNPRPPVNMLTGAISPSGVPNQITNRYPGTFGATGESFPLISTGEELNASLGTVTIVIT